MGPEVASPSNRTRYTQLVDFVTTYNLQLKPSMQYHEFDFSYNLTFKDEHYDANICSGQTDKDCEVFVEKRLKAKKFARV